MSPEFQALLIITFALLIIIIFFLIFYKDIFNYFTKVSELFRNFIKENDGFFSIIFIGLFMLEQALLIFLIYNFDNISVLKFIVSIFALWVITTASIQKLILDLKMKYENKEKQEINTRAKLFLRVMKDMIKSRDREINILKKKLNNN